MSQNDGKMGIQIYWEFHTGLTLRLQSGTKLFRSRITPFCHSLSTLHLQKRKPFCLPKRFANDIVLKDVRVQEETNGSHKGSKSSAVPFFSFKKQNQAEE